MQSDNDDSENGGSSNDPESMASVPIGTIHNSWFKYHMIYPHYITHIIFFHIKTLNRIKSLAFELK